ncbi:SH2 domain-containing adapter protein B isoform X2 [Neomonachus schauinslandi]|uniref:SH2 domain-containing adapter protein B isoform X2 n=1 Tax=Neomonachus schauinslandi TaxID=29088 RepID=A0A2Y9H639_NEOSC|nr:SH2 domain-containing adapter protein B isoform X2 [Neomonachus schauinslandi]
MAKWLNKYFSLGNSKTKSPPQPPRPDYREQRRRGERPSQPPQAVPQAPAGASASCGPAAASCFSTSSGSLPDDSGSTSDLIRAYRAQKERDFEDPYNGPGSSLRLLSLVRVGRRRLLLRLLRCRRRRVLVVVLRLPAPLPQQQRAAASHPGRGALHLPEAPPYQGGERRGRCGRPPGGCLLGRPHLEPDGLRWQETAQQVCRLGRGGERGRQKGQEFQRQESVRSQHKGIQLYDTPYEPEGQSIDSDSESTVSPRLRESKLPQDDDRPADEYDQPWEWNRVTIPALAAQFNGNEKRQSSPSPSRDRRRQLRAPGGGFKPIKHGSPEFCGILGERVDPAVPLEKQIWYHGAISRGDAENLLRLCKECSYLVRNSQTSKHDYSLSLKSNQGFMHMKLAKTKEKYVLGQNSPPFDSVPEVIHYYTTRKLPIKGAEHLSLLYPVAVRTL